MDSMNNVIFITSDLYTIQRILLPFHPSEVSFYELDPRILVALDKVDQARKVNRWSSN